MPTRDTPIRIGLLLIDGFALMSYAALIEPFRAANNLSGRPLYEWTHIAEQGDTARASTGVPLLVSHQIGDPLQADRLFVFAAGDPAEYRDPRCFAWLRRLARQGTAIGGVSGAPYLLARAGLLTNRRATIHWEHAEALREEFPTLALTPNLFVIDGPIMTCAGGTAGLDLALTLIAQDHGSTLAAKVGEWFIRTDPRTPERPQRPDPATRWNLADPRLLLALTAMEETLDDPLSRATLATRAGLSVRQLERLCARHLGRGISETYLRLRLDHAEHLLRTTGLGVTETAIASGFHSASHFSRRFKEVFGRAPSKAA